MPKVAIEFKDFSFQYLAQAEPTLKHINLTIYEGEKVLIIGPSGSGKSTLTSCINGLIPHSYKGHVRGQLLIKGKDVFQSEQALFERSKTIGSVLQDTDGQFIGLTVAEDIAFSLENDQISPSEMKARVLESSRLVKMADFLAQEPHALSGGQKQSVSLAGVLIDAVEILLFDEPLANLDPAAGQEAIALIDQLSREKNTTTVIVEHRLEDVLFRHVDRIILIADGTVAANLSADDLLSSPLLVTHGIRQPLYLAALSYAGIPITPNMHPEQLETLVITDETKNAVQHWFSTRNTPLDQEKKSDFLNIEHVSFSYQPDKPVLCDLNFSIEKGEFLAIVGQNGAGKSTLSKLICGFEKGATGKITLENQDLSVLTIAERAQKIGYVLQNPNQMISKAMIFDEVAMGLRARHLSEDQVKERVNQTLKICGLYPFRNWPIAALSFGQKKRVTIASILVLEPEILILDEPTAGQDYKHYTEIMTFLESLNHRGITIIIITHDMHLMLEYAKRVLVFGNQKCLADLTPEDLFSHPTLLKTANLKTTSLYELAKRCEIEDTSGFIRHFIDCERAISEKAEKEVEHG